MRRGGASALWEQLLVHCLAPVVYAGRARLLEVGQRQKQVDELGVAVLCDQPSKGVAPAPAAGPANDRQPSVRGWNFQVRSGFLAWRRGRHEARGFAALRGKTMTQDFIFAQDVILDPNTAKIVAVVRNGGVWRDGARIAVLVGAQMYDLNGNLLGKLAAGDGSLPISFKNLVGGKSAHAERALVA